MTIRDESDRELVTSIYLEHSRRLQAIARKYLENPLDVEDCVQDVIVALIDYLEKYKSWDDRHRYNFLVKCCRCIAINKYNKSEKQNMNEFSLSELGELDDIEGDEAEFSPEKLAVSEDNLRVLCDIIDNMDSKYADVLYLKGFLGMSNSEIARMLGISVESVGVRLMRARRIILTTKGDVLNEIRRK